MTHFFEATAILDPVHIDQRYPAGDDRRYRAMEDPPSHRKVVKVTEPTGELADTIVEIRAVKDAGWVANVYGGCKITIGDRVSYLVRE